MKTYFKKCCFSYALDGTEDDMLWQGSDDEDSDYEDGEESSEEDPSSSETEADKSVFRPARTRPGLKCRAGKRKAGRACLSGTAPVSARRFLHTRRVFPYPADISIPAGFSHTRRISQYPPGRLGNWRAGLEPDSASLLLRRRQ